MKKRILALTLTAALTIGAMAACNDNSAAKGSGVGGLVGNEVDNDGTIRDKYGASIGSARGVPKTWAGLYFFFSLN